MAGPRSVSNIRKDILWILSLAFLVAPLAAREARFDRLSVEDGLSHSSVWDVHQDSRGFLWFGTQEGLNRYDGYGFKVYKHSPDDPGAHSDCAVLAIHEDRTGDLWIGPRGGGLNRF